MDDKEDITLRDKIAINILSALINNKGVVNYAGGLQDKAAIEELCQFAYKVADIMRAVRIQEIK